MNFEEYKKQFDQGFAKVKPSEFIAHMEELGYEFEDISSLSSNEPIIFINEHIEWKQSSKNFRSDLIHIFKSLIFKSQHQDLINWKINDPLINVTAHGTTLEELTQEMESINFEFFKFQETIFENNHFSIKDKVERLNVELTEITLVEFESNNCNNNEAA